MKKAKIMIALSMALVIALGAGVGAGTYAYFSVNQASNDNQINVASFSSSLDINEKSFDANEIWPDKDLAYQTILTNNVGVDTDCTLTYTFNDVPGDGKSLDGYTGKFNTNNLFSHPTLLYYIYYNDTHEIGGTNPGSKHVATIRYDQSANGNQGKWVFLRNKDITSLEGYNIQILQDNVDQHVLKGINITFLEKSGTEKKHDFHLKIKWEYGNSNTSVVDNEYAGLETSSFKVSYEAKQHLYKSGDPDAQTALNFISGDKQCKLYYDLHQDKGQWTGGSDNLKTIPVWIKIGSNTPVEISTLTFELQSIPNVGNSYKNLVVVTDDNETIKVKMSESFMRQILKAKLSN